MLFNSCENDLETVKKISSKKEASIEKGKNVIALYSDQGNVKARLKAPVMKHNDDPKNAYTELPAGLLLEFYNDKMKIQSTLTSKFGISYDNTDEMIARDSVIVISENGDKLESEELIWNQKTQKIRSEKFVKITTDDEVIFGDGFESNQDISNYKIKKIRGSFKLKGNDGL
jgi:LPS export ABC transporter protein LptC